MLLFGGRNNERSCYSFNLSSQQWTKLPHLRSIRSCHSSIVVNSCIFLVGGAYNNTIDEFDHFTKSFKTVASIKESRRWFGSCLYKKSLVLVAGGRDDYDEVTNNCFLFNSNTKTFKEFASLSVKRSELVLVNFNGVVYSIGGTTEKREVLDSIETYDEGNDQWKMCDFKLNIARAYHQAVVHKNHIYIVGGWCRSGKCTNTIERVDVINGKVDLLRMKLRLARSGFTSCKFKSSLYIFGGYTGYGNSTNSVEILNLSTMKVQEGVKVPISDRSFSACVSENC